MKKEKKEYYKISKKNLDWLRMLAEYHIEGLEAQVFMTENDESLLTDMKEIVRIVKNVKKRGKIL